MKKSTKLISLLLVLVMLLSIIPMAVAADDGTIVYDGVTLYTTKKPTQFKWLRDNSENAVKKNVGETGIYQRLPRDTRIHQYCGRTAIEFIPDYYSASTTTVELSNPEILTDISYTISGWKGSGVYNGDPCLTFNYTAAKEGTTTVKLTFYYNYNCNGGYTYCQGCGRQVYIEPNTTWYQETTTFTVTVGDGEVPAPSKPDKPTESDVNNFFGRVNTTSSSEGAVYMWCDTFDHQAWFNYITDVDDAYTLGDVVANDGSVMSKTTYPWICVMTLDANKYLDAYNNSSEMAAYGTHYLKDGQPETESVTWYWNAAMNRWQYIEKAAPVYIDITHTAPTPEVTEYTVTYTDGVEDEEVFADQTYTVKEGDATPAFNGTPEREGYVFLGWDPKVAETVTGNVTYTATWELETYTISYDMRKVLKTGDYKNTNPTTFTVEDLPFSICAPTLKSEWAQKFLNWRDKDGNVVTKITEPGDITLYAYYKFLVRYRVYDEDGKEVEALASLDYYDEDDFTAGKVKFRALDLPGYEIDGWYQSTKDFGNVNKRAGSFYMAKKWELVGKLSCCINVTVMVDGEIQSTEKITGKKGETLNCFDSYYKITDQLRAEGKVPTEFKTLVDGKTGVTPAFGSCANVVLAFCTEGTITAEGDNWYWDDGAGNKTGITASIDFVPFV